MKPGLARELRRPVRPSELRLEPELELGSGGAEVEVARELELEAKLALKLGGSVALSRRLKLELGPELEFIGSLGGALKLRPLGMRPGPKRELRRDAGLTSELGLGLALELEAKLALKLEGKAAMSRVLKLELGPELEFIGSLGGALKLRPLGMRLGPTRELRRDAGLTSELGLGLALELEAKLALKLEGNVAVPRGLK